MMIDHGGALVDLEECDFGGTHFCLTVSQLCASVTTTIGSNKRIGSPAFFLTGALIHLPRPSTEKLAYILPSRTFPKGTVLAKDLPDFWSR
jgi:hypothetical protein